MCHLELLILYLLQNLKNLVKKTIENSTVVFQDSVVLDGTLHIKDSDVNFNYGIRGGFIETSGKTVIHARLSLGSLSKLDGCDLGGKVDLSLSM